MWWTHVETACFFPLVFIHMNNWIWRPCFIWLNMGTCRIWNVHIGLHIKPCLLDSFPVVTSDEEEIQRGDIIQCCYLESPQFKWQQSFLDGKAVLNKQLTGDTRNTNTVGWKELGNGLFVVWEISLWCLIQKQQCFVRVGDSWWPRNAALSNRPMSSEGLSDTKTLHRAL